MSYIGRKGKIGVNLLIRINKGIMGRAIYKVKEKEVDTMIRRCGRIKIRMEIQINMSIIIILMLDFRIVSRKRGMVESMLLIALNSKKL